VFSPFRLFDDNSVSKFSSKVWAFCDSLDINFKVSVVVVAKICMAPSSIAIIFFKKIIYQLIDIANWFNWY